MQSPKPPGVHPREISSPLILRQPNTKNHCGCGARSSLYNALAMNKRILSVSYDQPLLVTRQMILEQAGFDVSSAFGFAEALEVCQTRHDFDLILMGHSMPQKDKMALIAALRPKCSAPLLSILRHGDSPIPQADYSVDSADGPAVLLDAVKAALK
jgi:CheY-like chemotaxis protein